MLGKADTVAAACEQTRAALTDSARPFSTRLDDEVKGALDMLSKLVDVPRCDVGVKLQEALELPRLSTALA